MTYLVLISFLILLFSLSTGTYKLETSEKTGRFMISIDNARFWVVFVLLLFLTAFRGESVGNDTLAYMREYEVNVLYGISNGLNFEIGYQFFCVLISKVSNDPRAIIIATSILCYITFGTYYYKRCNKPYWALALFYPLFFSSFTNVVRMACSISFLLWAYDSAQSKRIFKTIFWTTLAVSFHITSVAFIPLAIIIYKDIKFTPKLFGILTIILTVLCAEGNYVLRIISLILSKFGSRFLKTDYLTGSRTDTGFLGVLLLIITLFVIYLCYAQVVEKEDRSEGVKWLFSFTLVFYILSFAMNLFDRLASLFLFILIVPLVNDMIVSQKQNKQRYILFLCFSVTFIFLMKCYLRPEWNNLFPYEFMWQ